MKEIPALILAAGESSRLGQPKQLLTYQGQTLLQRAIHTAQEAQLSPVIVVLGAFREQIAPSLSGWSCEVVINSAWKEGMGSSLQRGITYLIQHYPQAPACLTMLCDQPLLSPLHLTHLVRLWEKGRHPIIATQYGETIGVPILWDSHYFSKLSQVNGQVGARKLLKTYSAEVDTVICEPAAYDVDTQEDYKSLKGF